MSQLIKPQIQWTPEKIQLLKDEYPLGDKNQLAKKLGIKRSTLKEAARRFKIKSLIDKRKYKASKLLNDSLESYYWHGFIIADGHIGKRNNIKITVSPKDEGHLIKFRNFLEVEQPIKHNTQNTTYANNTESVTISISDVNACEQLRNLYKVGHTKTINPPNLLKILNDSDKFVSFFFGLFDGDGCFCMQKSKVVAMKFELHSSWMEVLESIQIALEKHFKIESRISMTSRGYSKLMIYKNENFRKFKNLTLDMNIPVMERKWNKLI